jgi:hypothetical protein
MPSKNQKKAKKAAAAGATPILKITPPENFQKVIGDMCTELTVTFPEFAHLWKIWTNESFQSMEEEARTQEVQKLFDFCITVYPERFFDILYKNTEMFDTSKKNDINTFFLPSVDFTTLFTCEGVSENTCNVLWNYLQLILFTIIGSVQDKSKFGDSKNLFDGIDESDLLEKLSETMKNMSSFFQEDHEDDDDHDAEENREKTKPSEKDDDDSDAEDNDDNKEKEPKKKPKPFSMPNLDDLHKHLKGLFDGKIGTLAKELAEEISGDLSGLLGEDMKDIRSTKDMFQKIMKNPAKISELIKTIGDKIKKKMSSGEISQEELMKEATELMNKMKDMGGGMDAFKDMFKNMGMNIPKNARMDTNALNRMTQHQSTRERLKARMMKKQAAQTEAFLKTAEAMKAMQEMHERQGTAQADLETIAQKMGLDLNEMCNTPVPPVSKKKKSK